MGLSFYLQYSNPHFSDSDTSAGTFESDVSSLNSTSDSASSSDEQEDEEEFSIDEISPDKDQFVIVKLDYSKSNRNRTKVEEKYFVARVLEEQNDKNEFNCKFMRPVTCMKDVGISISKHFNQKNILKVFSDDEITFRRNTLYCVKKLKYKF